MSSYSFLPAGLPVAMQPSGVVILELPQRQLVSPYVILNTFRMENPTGQLLNGEERYGNTELQNSTFQNVARLQH